MSSAPRREQIPQRPLLSLKKRSDAPVLILPPDAASADLATAKEPSRVTVATFNILFDMYEADLIYSDKRLAQVSRELDSLGADVIGLQEVSEKALAHIRAASSTLSKEYYCACLPSDTDYSQALFSRFPILDAVACRMSRYKRCIFYELLLPSGAHLIVCNAHLISAFGGDNGPTRRLEELEFIFSSLAPYDCALVLGDFNFGDDDPEQMVFPWPSSFVDSSGVTLTPTPSFGKNGHKLLWKDKIAILASQAATPPSGNSPFYSFDLSKNPLADLMSRDVRRPRRLDRILVKGFDLLKRAMVFADKPFGWRQPVTRGGDPALGLPSLLSQATHVDGLEPMFPSDHFGVVCILSGPLLVPNVASAELSVKPVEVPLPNKQTSFRTALVLVIPPEFHAVINEYRAVHDKAFPRWMPHITILFPFVPVSDFHVAAGVLQQKLRDLSCKPFRIQLTRSGSFSKGKGGAVIYLEPQDEAMQQSQNLAMIYTAASELFPWCGRDGGGDFHPHVTLGQFSRQQEQQARASVDSRLAALPEKIEFDVNGVQLIAHLDGEDGYRVLEEVLL